MISEKIYFDENDRRVFLDVYAVAEPNTAARDAILVIPGGGYSFVSWREGIYTALDFLGKGINTFVLTYSTGAHAVYPRQLLDAGRALDYIKKNADRYNINPERIFALGYSAGGHLLGTLTTLHSVAERELGLPEDYLKIRGAIFCYPVVTAYGATHQGSFVNLLKKPFDEYTEAERELLSIEKNVNADTPPAFIWHTAGDLGVPINGSLKLAQAYYDAGVTVELHLYPYGPHGICLANEVSSSGNPALVQPRATAWVGEAFKWMKDLDK
jgi:acetyl esterase/lipase